MITALDHVTNDATREAAQEWLDSAAAAVAPALRQPLIDDLSAALCAGLDPEATPRDLAALIDRLGPVIDLAAEDVEPGTGRWFGIPYDFRPLTSERLRATLWDPRDPRLLRGRAYGIGWDLNVGALAVRLGLIEPDAEDEPFDTTPHDAFVLGAALPALLAAAVVAHYAVRGSSLPRHLPHHWDAAGRPDRWIRKGAAATLDIALALGSAGLGTAAAASRTHGAGRAIRLAVAAAGATAAATITVARPLQRGAWWIGPGLAAGTLGSAGATLLGLALAGRDAERRRDLGR